jgi:hypothetical protein
MSTFSELIARRKQRVQRGELPLYRRLTDKAFSYQLVKKAGVPIPTLYDESSSCYFEIKPEYTASFVAKARRGHSGKEVMCIHQGIDLFTGQAPNSAAFNQILLRKNSGYLVEQFIPAQCGSYEVVESFKVFYFGAAGMVVRYVRERFDTKKRTIQALAQSFYDEQWQYVETPLSHYVKQGPAIAKPIYLPELLKYANIAGDLVGSFVRVDFFMSPTGPVFNEFCLYPFNGRHFTDYGERYFARMWQQGFPEEFTQLQCQLA